MWRNNGLAFGRVNNKFRCVEIILNDFDVFGFFNIIIDSIWLLNLNMMFTLKFTVQLNFL